MEQLFLKSVEALKQYDCIVSTKEWNKIAKEYNFMSSKSMCYISKLSWNKLSKMIRKNN